LLPGGFGLPVLANCVHIVSIVSETALSVASNAGAATHPAWYRNVVAHPELSLQDGATVHPVRAREVHGDEKGRWWRIAERDWPHFPGYRAKAGDRDIPVMLLEPVEGR